jgi:hypothetical protein
MHLDIHMSRYIICLKSPKFKVAYNLGLPTKGVQFITKLGEVHPVVCANNFVYPVQSIQDRSKLVIEKFKYTM